MAASAASASSAQRKSVLVTGGAGFIGANLCLALAERHPGWELIALDNLKRRGSELNLSRLREANVRFVHGDVRHPADLNELSGLDAVVECSAEPSVLAGVESPPDYALHTNLSGAYHCLELAGEKRPNSSTCRRAASTRLPHSRPSDTRRSRPGSRSATSRSSPASAPEESRSPSR
jgi:nucleoside-diphosphate-sugar epimerase